MDYTIMKSHHFYMSVLILFLLVSNIVSAEEPKSKWLNENPCMIKVIITNTEIDGVTTTSKEEVLKCKDGYDGPNYWELFAQFYYSGITIPAYCRPYARPKHPFKTPGMLCLNEKGVWQKQ
tara:strand:- start:306 stop:668 length:363 start_codon:yes stop_codon:yes gene_type:complete